MNRPRSKAGPVVLLAACAFALSWALGVAFAAWRSPGMLWLLDGVRLC